MMDSLKWHLFEGGVDFPRQLWQTHDIDQRGKITGLLVHVVDPDLNFYLIFPPKKNGLHLHACLLSSRRHFPIWLKIEISLDWKLKILFLSKVKKLFSSEISKGNWKLHVCFWVDATLPFDWKLKSSFTKEINILSSTKDNKYKTKLESI